MTDFTESREDDEFGPVTPSRLPALPRIDTKRSPSKTHLEKIEASLETLHEVSGAFFSVVGPRIEALKRGELETGKLLAQLNRKITTLEKRFSNQEIRLGEAYVLAEQNQQTLSDLSNKVQKILDHILGQTIEREDKT